LSFPSDCLLLSEAESSRPAQRKLSSEVTIITNATDLCRVAIRRLGPDQLDAVIDGDRELGDLVLAAIGALARD
jgi:hypothetical protein